MAKHSLPNLTLDIQSAKTFGAPDSRACRVYVVSNGDVSWIAKELKDLGPAIVEATKEWKTVAPLADAKWTHSPQFKAAHIHRPEGGTIAIVWPQSGLDRFEVTEGIRKHLEKSVHRAEHIEVDLSKASASAAQDWILDLSSLVVLGSYEAPTYGLRSAKKKAEPKSKTLVFRSSLTPKVLQEQFSTGVELGLANNQVRYLSDLPPNHLNPTQYRKRLEAFAKSSKAKLEYLDVSALKKLGAGSFLAVVQADPATDSGIAHLSWKPSGKGPFKKVVFVGKGLCYDTGGYNVKTGDYMNGMHRDMTGSAVAFALFDLFQRQQLKVEVHALLAIAENHISPLGYKPNDVVVAMDGTSIEVFNTDAEGRMCLADTLAYAARLEADLVIDFATLTGSAFRALDRRRSAIYSNREQLAQMGVRVGDDVGERTWSFPLSRDYRDGLKSEYADLMQCSPGTNSDHIYAATFLRHFMGETTPWIHMDLCAHRNKGGLGLVSTDETGYGVRWGYELARRFLKV